MRDGDRKTDTSICRDVSKVARCEQLEKLDKRLWQIFVLFFQLPVSLKLFQNKRKKTEILKSILKQESSGY